MFKGKKFFALALITIFILALAGCSGKTSAPAQDQPKEPAIVNADLGTDPGGIDPQKETTLVAYSMAREVFSTLVRFKGQSMELEPELLAEMPTVSEDGKTYHFTLKSGLKFNDGSTLDAKDVKYTFERLLDPKLASPNTWFVEDLIVGAKDKLEGKANEVAGVKVTGDLTFDIELTQPYAPFLSILAVPFASIYPEEAANVTPEEFALKPIGSGPFMVKEWVRDDHLDYVKNPYYFEKDIPKVDGVHYVFLGDAATGMLEFENGNIDTVTPSDEEIIQMRQDPNKKDLLVDTISLNTWYLLPNVEDPVLKDVRVRQAISLAIDREKLVKEVLNGMGEPAHGFLPPGLPGYDESSSVLEYNPEKAKQLLAEAGYGPDHPLKIESWQRGSAESTMKRHVAIQAMLKEVGIEMEIKPMEKGIFNPNRAEGKIPLHFGNWYADFPDADNFFYGYVHSSQSKGMSSNYKNPEVDKLLEQGRLETDPAKRAEIYKKVDQIVTRQDYAIIPIFHKGGAVAVQPWLKGYFVPVNEVTTFRDVWIEGKPAK